MLTRESYLSKIRGFYNSDLVKILVGIRRCGKSVILQQIIKELKDDGVEELLTFHIFLYRQEFLLNRNYKNLLFLINNSL